MLGDFPNEKVVGPNQPAKPNVPNRLTNQDIDGLVNKHLWMTGQKQDMHEQSEAAKNQVVSPKIGDKILAPKLKQATTQLGLDADANETNAYNDLHRYRKELQIYKPDNQIQAQLADQQAFDKFETAYQEAYIKQFIENARLNGYEVRLNDKNEVVTVRPIRLPSNQLTAPSQGGPAAR